MLFAKWSAPATTYFGGYFFPSSDTSTYFSLVVCSGTPFSSINFRASITSCFFSFGIAMLHLLESVYTHYITRIALFSIQYPAFIALKCNFSTNISWFSVSPVSNILCIEIPLYRLYGFVGYFAQPQICALPSEPYTLYSDSLFHKGTAWER